MAVDTDSELLLNEAKKIIWGDEPRIEIFSRWLQGFILSEDEPSALKQMAGGPCAVIAPVQAYIAKSLIRDFPQQDWKMAMVDILIQIAKHDSYWICYPEKEVRNSSIRKAGGETASYKLELPAFHSFLRLTNISGEAKLKEMLEEQIESFESDIGILMFLYSVVLTKGLEAIRSELEDQTESLIDGSHGLGSQSLINLMITGKAVSHLWDNDRTIGGLRLNGIDCRSQIGYLSLLEYLRYCEVGNYLKNPLHPVWILGSESHLTVLFSCCTSLVREETPVEKAKRIFQQCDPEGNGFVSATLLHEVLEKCSLVCDPLYVDFIKKKLDSENLGIIIWNSFKEEFFPDAREPEVTETFVIYHCNGLVGSKPNGKVVYDRGVAALLASNVKYAVDNDPMQTCLQTKWPNIEVQWDRGESPSLN